MRQTTIINDSQVKKQWYEIDASELILGRLASQIALILRGKNKPSYTPHVDCGDYVIVTNIDKIVFTGKKWDQKKYYRHSGFPGGLSSRNALNVKKTKPELLLTTAVRKMLPKGVLGRKQLKHLFVYAGDKNPHSAQKPIALKLNHNATKKEDYFG